MAITTDPGFMNYSGGDFELQEGLDLFSQITYFKNHSMADFGPRELTAVDQTDNLKDYIINMDIDSVSKVLLVKNLDKVMDSLEDAQYKQAFVKLKVFMMEAKLLEPKVISREQFDYIIDGSLKICMMVWDEVQIPNTGIEDTKIDQLLSFLENFITAKDKSGDFNDLMDEIDDIIKML